MADDENRDPSNRLTDLVRRLRGPDGCPWDREQEIDDIRGYLLEEAHEVAAAIDHGDWNDIRDELGDLLFQIVFVAQLAGERGEFAFDQVVDQIETKMIARHPHVFGDDKATDSAEVRRAWELRKAAQNPPGRSVLDGVPTSLPALLGAYRLSQKAAAVGFDWPDPEAVIDKLEEEIEELRGEIAAHRAKDADQAIEEELGDLMFATANLARQLGFDPEAALARANAKFKRRFARLEEELSQRGDSLQETSLETMESVWNHIKHRSPE